MKTLNKLTAKKFAEIYSNEEFRNQVAYAHACHKANGEFEYKKTCSYPDSWIVTDEQIAEAQKEVERRKVEVIKENEGKLMFVGMGSTYEPRYEDDVCNHRIRVEFKNPAGRLFFIELGTGRGEEMRIDHAVDRTREDELNGNPNRQSEFYNYKKLERQQDMPRYTKRNVLDLVNRHFECNFKEMIVDNYNVTTDDFISVSPKG